MKVRDIRDSGYAGWTDKDWTDLIRKVRTCALSGLSEDKIRKIAWSYMQNGSDGGGNDFGLLGTLVAVCVDEVATARYEEQT